MARKTLGVIGLGELVSHFFNNLNNLDVDSFKKEVGQVLFFNHGYEESDFRLKLDKKNEKTGKSIADSLKECGYDSLFRNSFEELFIESHVILDGSGGWMGWSKEESPYSLLRYARALGNGKKDVILSMDKDRITYEDEIKKKGRIIDVLDGFEQNWNFSRGVLEVIREIDDLLSGKENVSVYGMRTYEEFPFSLQMIIDRGRKMKEVVDKGRPLPTYILMVNEPCLMGSVMSSLCPEMTSYLVAGTAFEEIRLNQILNDNKDYKALKRRAGLEKVDLLLSLRGFHDDYGVVPWLTGASAKDSSIFQQFCGELSDFSKFYEGLRDDVRKCYGRMKDEGGDPNVSVDRALLSTIVNAARSRGKALSVYPVYDERALCNGYYHPKVLGTGKKMFFVGQHRFRNGKVIANDTC